MSLAWLRFDWLNRPFWGLVAHFARRLFTSEESSGSSQLHMGLGATLVLVALPGAFASLFLMDKYSTLLQYFRGQRGFNPYNASISDEYFFIVFAMTITGLMMVLRWNRLFPDRRDFANLAVLPIPIYHVFLANFVALLALGCLFVIDVNLVSSFLFPIFVTMQDGSAKAFLHFAFSHGITVLLASALSFFGVLSLIGVLMATLPQRLFAVASLVFRIVLAVILVMTCFSNLFLQLLIGRAPDYATWYFRALPPVWFLALFEKSMGLVKPGMAGLASRSTYALVIAFSVCVAAYAAGYRRRFLRLPETMDVIETPRIQLRFFRSERLRRLLFGSSFEDGCFAFIAKTLLRSERHMMFVGAYWGMGLVAVAQTAVSPLMRKGASVIPDSDILTIPILAIFFLLTGLRFVFDMPAAFEANWIFRIAAEEPQPSPAGIVRRFLLWVTMPWQLFLLVPVMAWRFGWSIAILEGIIVLSGTLVLTEILLVRFNKIPFTCSQAPEMKPLMLRIIFCLIGVLVVVPGIVAFEQWIFVKPFRVIFWVFLLAAGLYALHRYRADLVDGQAEITFDERPAAAFELIKLG